MANSFMGMVYAVLKENKVDTSNMTPKECVEKFNELSSKENLKKEEIKTHNKKYIWLPEQEYAGINSVIKKRFGNDIPKQGGIFYNNDYYVYNFNEFTDQILCVEKLDIDKDEARIALLEDLWKKKQ